MDDNFRFRWLNISFRLRLWWLVHVTFLNETLLKDAGLLNRNVKSLSYDFQVFDFAKISFHKNYIRMVFRQCDSIHVVLNCIYNWLHSHIHRIWNAFVLDLRLTSSLGITQHPNTDASRRPEVRVTRMKSPSYMDSFVSCNIALLIRTKVTFVTFERFFTSMNTLMNIQIWFSTCWKFTEVTFIRTYRTLSKILNIKASELN